ncbi:MAG: TonB-dependent receptor plug domain-containing protein, partial [Bacteroidota bacterium]|nr:TonB-dependent receptor plug domain-containing protein [Bacteroidota bacterium]
MKKIFVYILLLVKFANCIAQVKDTVNLPEINVFSSIKTEDNFQKTTSAVDSYNQQYMNNHNVKDFKDFSSHTPSLYIPDYGSKITSTIYLRGLGSRIDNSSVGVCLDGVMLLNKNCFDFSYFDFYKVDIFKGAQSLTFGMNTMAGVINLTTLSPFNYQGTKASVGIANGSTYNASFSHYNKLSKHWGFMIGADFSSTQGYFDNSFNGEDCDWGRFGNARLIFEYKKNNVSAKNSTYLSFVRQGGYPYSLFDTIKNTTAKVNYNDECGYDRLNLINNTSYTYSNRGKFVFHSLSSVQLNFDELELDNDFTSLSYFTLHQKEKDYAFSQEFIFKDDNHNNKWNWIGGAFVFYKYLDMQAPVLFKQDGINALILDNANNG